MEVQASNPKTDWALIVACLHDSGELKLTIEEELMVRRQADGLGEGIALTEVLMDWSHVRDSSDEAIWRMAFMLRCWNYEASEQ